MGCVAQWVLAVVFVVADCSYRDRSAVRTSGAVHRTSGANVTQSTQAHGLVFTVYPSEVVDSEDAGEQGVAVSGEGRARLAPARPAAVRNNPLLVLNPSWDAVTILLPSPGPGLRLLSLFPGLICLDSPLVRIGAWSSAVLAWDVDGVFCGNGTRGAAVLW